MDKFGFACLNCGTLARAEEAGEREFPAACTICGHGVSYNQVTGIKEYNDSNWLVLADDSPERDAVLAKHGLTTKDVAKHKPVPPAAADREPTSIDRTTVDSIGAEDIV